MFHPFSIKKILFVAVLFIPSLTTAMEDGPTSYEELTGQSSFSPNPGTFCVPEQSLPPLKNPLQILMTSLSKKPFSEEKMSFLKESLFLLIPQGFGFLLSKVSSSTFQKDIWKVSGMNALFWCSAIAAVKCSETTQNHLQNNQNLSTKNLSQWTTTLPLALCFGTIPSFFLSLCSDQNNWELLSNTTKKNIKGLAAMGLALQCGILSYYFNQYTDALSSPTESYRE